MVDAFKKLNGKHTDAVEAVVANYEYSLEKAEKAVGKYWNA